MYKADTRIRNEAASALSDALKVNTTLTRLDLEGVRQQQDKTQQAHNTNLDGKTVNEIWDEGVCTLSETLKVNIALTTLDLGSINHHKTSKKAKARMN
mgnify:CR=1 FL=1